MPSTPTLEQYLSFDANFDPPQFSLDNTFNERYSFLSLYDGTSQWGLSKNNSLHCIHSSQKKSLRLQIVIILHYTSRRSPLYNAVIIIERKLPPLMHISAGNTFVDCAKIAFSHSSRFFQVFLFEYFTFQRVGRHYSRSTRISNFYLISGLGYYIPLKL